MAGHLDGWLVGWFAVAAWVVLWVAERRGFSVARLDGPFYWVVLATSAMHFGISYHLAYADARRTVRSRPIVLVVAPVALGIVLTIAIAVALSSGSDSRRGFTSALLTSVYLLTIWHYIKQAYGIARLGAAYANISLTISEVRILRYGLYPLWLMSVAKLLTRGRGFSFSGYRIGAEILPGEVLSVMRIIAILCAVLVAGVFAGLARRSGGWPPGLMLAPYVASFLWLGIPLTYSSAGLLLGVFHATQYIACAHRAEAAVARTQHEPANLRRWLEIFGGAVCGGLLLTTWAPQALNRAYVGGGEPLLFSAAFFVFLNLHHYMVDAVIWRSKGELVRAMVA
ncbi:unannotated protein [freshwater metagenome]|uniref:Unannotated protein n=1 Tax=freshwater metagenome TaxID=449393 RepID=A0A6J7FAF8_9ZZZZ